MYDGDLALSGFHVGGGVDYEWLDDCAAVHSVQQATETFAPARRVIHRLCESGWPSARLCGAQPACGDGICSAEERPTCRADCVPASCGDRTCELSERGACNSDCDPFPNVPQTWPGDPAAYAGPPSPSRKPAASGGACQFEPPFADFSCWWVVLPSACVVLARRRLAGSRHARPDGRPRENHRSTAPSAPQRPR